MFLDTLLYRSKSSSPSLILYLTVFLIFTSNYFVNAANILQVNPAYLTIAKGSTGTFLLSLGPGDSTPTNTVTVTFTCAGTTFSTSSGGPTCIFSSTMTSACTVTVTATQDNTVSAKAVNTLTMAVTSSDPSYSGLTPTPTVQVTILDNNGFSTSTTAPNPVFQGDSRPNFDVTVTPKASPTQPVTVTITFASGSLPCTTVTHVFPSGSAAPYSFKCNKGWDDLEPTGTTPYTGNIQFFVTSSTDPKFTTDQIIPQLTLNIQPGGFEIEADPDPTAVVEGSAAYFYVNVLLATGVTVTYQWQVDNSQATSQTRRREINAPNWVNVVSASATTPTLVVPTTIASNLNGNQYRVIVANGLSSYATTGAKLTVLFAPGSAAAASSAFGGSGGSGSSSGGSSSGGGSSSSSNSGSGSASGFGDPHFVGWNGAMFDFEGEDGNVYNLITDSALQVNMRLGRLYASSRTILPGVYMVEMGVKISTSTSIRLLAGGAGGTGEGQLLLNGASLPLKEAFALPLNVSQTIFDGACSMEYRPLNQPASVYKVPDESERVIGEVRITLGSRYTFSLLRLERVGYYLLPRRTLAIVGYIGNQDVQPHGIIGQTANKEQERKRALTPENWKIQGSSTDYQVVSNEIFGSDFKFNKF